MSDNWKEQTERGSVYGIRIMVWIYRRLGEKICKILLFPVLLYFYITGGKVRAGLKAFYLQAQQVDKRIKATPLSNVLNFGFGLIDRLSLLTGQFCMTKIRPHNSDLLYKHIKSGKGGIIFSSHLGNFDLCRAAGRERLPVKMNVLVDMSNAKKINQVMRSVNEDFLIDIIPINQIDMILAMQLKEKVDNGEFVVIAADRMNTNSVDKAHGVFVPFIGKEAEFPIGPYVLAKVLGCPVFSLYCFRSKDGKYDIFFHRLFDCVHFDRNNREEQIEKYAEQYAQQLGEYCLCYPKQWYNFYNFWK